MKGHRVAKVVVGLVLGATLASLLGACAVEVSEGRHCRYGWEPAHRDRLGRVVPGHCR